MANNKYSGFPRVTEFLEYHGILKGLFQTLKVREFNIFYVQVMKYQGFLFVTLNFSFHLSKCNFCSIFYIALFHTFAYCCKAIFQCHFIPFPLVNWQSRKSNAVTRLYLLTKANMPGKFKFQELWLQNEHFKDDV